MVDTELSDLMRAAEPSGRDGAGLLAALACATGAQAALLCGIGAGGARMIGAHGLSCGQADAYARCWVARDPWLSALPPAAPPGSVFAGHDLVPPDVLQANAFARAWLVPAGQAEALLGLPPQPDGSKRVIILLRPAGHPFAAREHAVLRAVFCGAAAPVQGPMPGDAPNLSSVLQQAAVPMLLLRPDATQLWANRAGARLLGPAGPLVRVGDRVRPRVPGAAPAFAHALAEAARHAAILLLPGADGTARQMRLMPAGLPATAPAVLLAADPGPGWRPPAGLVAQAMGLTRVQGELLSWLCTGLGTVELCARLRVSPHTLRAHLSLLLARTGAANRAALIAQVMQRVMPLLLVGAPPVTTEAAEFLPGNQSEELMT